MPEFIEREVEGMRDSSSSDQVTLLVGYDGDRDELAETIQDLGGEVDDMIGRTTLQITIPESGINELCETPGVISVERDEDDVRTLPAGNFKSRPGSTK